MKDLLTLAEGVAILGAAGLLTLGMLALLVAVLRSRAAARRIAYEAGVADGIREERARREARDLADLNATVAAWSAEGGVR